MHGMELWREGVLEKPARFRWRAVGACASPAVALNFAVPGWVHT